MIYPKEFEEKIGFDVIRTLLRNRAVSDIGKEWVEKLAYSDDYETVIQQLNETQQFHELTLYDTAIQFIEFKDVRKLLKNIRLEGQFLEIDELAAVRDVIKMIIDIFVYFRIKNDDEKYPALWALCQDILLEKELLSDINIIIDEKGHFRDSASEELRRIRREMIKISAEADKKVRKLLVSAKAEGWVKEDAEMTVRNGRLCIPMLAQFKRRLQGFVHDESATGQTVFIEPTDVFDANNELRDLQNAEKREIIRILTEISNQIRNANDSILAGHELLGKIDFLRAKALLAISMEGKRPNVLNGQTIQWSDAIHPLLFLKFKKTNKKVVPLQLKLDPEERILIISGPNAGGKSVCLKTVGLLQYMMQCGLLVPMKETSDMGIFSSFFVALGDEQSIDNDLSTYSSHLTNLKVMIEHLTADSLFLIDEFGSGTEPTLGGAMAEAILEHLYDKKSFGIITTHYGNLKAFCDTHPEAINGAMLFNIEKMEPLFLLKQHRPGSSFTYEIAQQIGLPQEIINAALSKSGTAQIDYERKLEQIDLDRLEVERQLKMMTQSDEKLAELIADYSAKFTAFEKQRKTLLQNAKNQAIAIVESANQVIEKTIREIKEAKAENEKTKKIRAELAKEKKEVVTKIENIAKKDEVKPIVKIKHAPTPSRQSEEDDKIKVGDAVFLTDIQTVGEVVALQGNDVTVSFNSITFKTRLKKVAKISKKEAKAVNRHGMEAAKWNGSKIGDIMNDKIAKFNTSIDIRGERAEDAIHLIETYIDEAAMLNIKEVKILHGKGNGILRSVVRQFLSKRKEIALFEDEILELGGHGITVVQLK